LKTDRELARAMLAGDESAFDAYFREYAPRVYRFVLPRLAGDKSQAEEICQEVLARSMQKIDGWRGEASLFTWLCQMARNEITDHWRRQRRQGQFEMLIEDEPGVAAALESIEGAVADRPDQQQSRSELLRLVQVALDRLPSNYGQALELKYIDGESVQDIARRFDQTTIATQSLLARARSAFRDAITTLTGRELGDIIPFAGEDSGRE